MRIPVIAPADLTPDQKPLYEDMRAGIAQNFKGFTAIGDDGALLGPFNPWVHEPKFGKPIWDLVKAISTSPSLPKSIREIAILVTGAKFRSAYELYAHVLVAEQRGLPDDKLATIVAGQRPGDLTREEAIAYDVASAARDRRAAGADLSASGQDLWATCDRRADLSDRRLLSGVGHAQRL
jgi:alkylhydroperoxidase family enzyme